MMYSMNDIYLLMILIIVSILLAIYIYYNLYYMIYLRYPNIRLLKNRKRKKLEEI
jgi:hypothetical protein